jgi:hypothetical protein
MSPTRTLPRVAAADKLLRLRCFARRKRYCQCDGICAPVSVKCEQVPGKQLRPCWLAALLATGASLGPRCKFKGPANGVHACSSLQTCQTCHTDAAPFYYLDKYHGMTLTTACSCLCTVSQCHGIWLASSCTAALSAHHTQLLSQWLHLQ